LTRSAARISRPVDDDKHVMLDLDFDSAQEADTSSPS
jgi:hypothetical protein